MQNVLFMQNQPTLPDKAAKLELRINMTSCPYLSIMRCGACAHLRKCLRVRPMQGKTKAVPGGAGGKIAVGRQCCMAVVDQAVPFHMHVYCA